MEFYFHLHKWLIALTDFWRESLSVCNANQMTKSSCVYSRWSCRGISSCWDRWKAKHQIANTEKRILPFLARVECQELERCGLELLEFGRDQTSSLLKKNRIIKKKIELKSHNFKNWVFYVKKNFRKCVLLNQGLTKREALLHSWSTQGSVSKFDSYTTIISNIL